MAEATSRSLIRDCSEEVPAGSPGAAAGDPFGPVPTPVHPTLPPATRVCRRCGVEKAIAEFYLLRASGRREQPCRACQRAYRRRYYAENRERLVAVQRRYVREREDPERRRARNARIARRQRAKVATRRQREESAVRRRTQRLRYLGLLSLAEKCEDCGAPAVLVHHETYDDVCALVSLCRACHMVRHYRVWRRTGGGPVKYPHEYPEEEG